MDTFDKNTQVVARLIEDLYEITALYQSGAESVSFALTPRFESDKLPKMLKDRLSTAGYEFDLDDDPENLVLTINTHPRLKIPLLNLVMFFATALSIYFVPVFLKMLPIAVSFSEAIDLTFAALKQGAGIEFSLAMLSILFVHEMGHYVASRRRNLVTSWPYFIPAPSIIGTFGAIIKSKSPFWNRRDLIEVGAAGPIAGWIVALFWLVYGLTKSELLPQAMFAPWELLFSMDGESILMRFLTSLFVGAESEGYFFRLSEAAFAGWVGLLVTAINMLPIGQLDGGHVIYGLLRTRQHRLGQLAILGLLILGIWSPIWWVFAAFGLIFGIKHPPTLNDSLPPDRTARIMGWVALIILVISFTPIPFR